MDDEKYDDKEKKETEEVYEDAYDDMISEEEHQDGSDLSCGAKEYLSEEELPEDCKEDYSEEESFREESFEDEPLEERSAGQETSEKEYPADEYTYTKDLSFGFEEEEEEPVDFDDEFNDEEDERGAFSKEYTVSTQGFYEQYGDEIKASLKIIPEEEIYEEYEAAEEPEKVPRKKRKKKHYLIKFLVLAVLITGAAVFALSSFFNIKTISVEGQKNTTAEDIIKASGIKKGQNIFRISEGDVIDSMKENAYMSSVRIRRKLPDKITIIVDEREEAAFIRYGSEKIIIDETGYVLRKTTKKTRLTELKNLKIEDMTIGHKLKVKDEVILEKTLDVIGAMKKADMFFKKVEVRKVVIMAYLNDSFLCRGRPDSIINNMENGNLKAIISDLYKKGKRKGTINVGEGKYCSYSPKID